MTYEKSSPSIVNSSFTLLAARSGRVGFSVRNDSTAVLYLSYGASASSASLVKIEAGGFYEDPYSNRSPQDRNPESDGPAIYGYGSATNGNARVMEVYK